MGNQPEQPNFLTPPEAAIRAGVTPRCVTGWCWRVPGLAVRVMGRWRVDPAALDRLLRGQMPLSAGGDHAQAA
jgi:hypothetical protein